MTPSVVLLRVGDNILTAVNVARSCGMVGADEKVVFVTANPHSTQSAPTLRFSLEEQGGAAAAANPPDGLSQVGGTFQVPVCCSACCLLDYSCVSLKCSHICSVKNQTGPDLILQFHHVHAHVHAHATRRFHSESVTVKAVQQKQFPRVPERISVSHLCCRDNSSSEFLQSEVVRAAFVPQGQGKRGWASFVPNI